MSQRVKTSARALVFTRSS